MTQQNKAGMWLREAPESEQRNPLWLIQTLVALLASAFSVLTITGLTGNPWLLMLAVTVSLSIAYALLLKTGHASWFYLGTLTVMLVLTLICRRQVLEGFRIFWNRTNEAMVLGTGRVLPEWELQLSQAQSGLSASLFAVLSACLLSLVCCALTSFAPVFLSCALSAAVLTGMIVLGVNEGYVWILPVLGASVLILIYSGWRKKGTAAPVLAGWAVCIIAACLLIAAAVTPGIQNWAVGVQRNVRSQFHESHYETKYTTLPEGNFSDYQNTDREAEPALAVTMENPQQLYLRGFTGAEFSADRWEPLDKAALAKNRHLLYWLNINAFDQNAQFDAAAAYAGISRSTVAVQNIGACSYYRYVPFSIGKGAWSQAEDLNTDGVHAEGERSYVYSVSAGSSEELMQVLTHLQSSDDPAVLRYRKAESGYRQFVKHYYLQIPEEVRELLQEQWDAVAAGYGGSAHLTLQQAQECALIFLSRCFPEEGTPEDMELPLEMAEGTSFQYATVAAMTLRYFGIPARYAEGYVISPEMAAVSESGAPIAVDSSCAKAWVEVYQEGIGWIPMDLTPGIGEILEDPDSSDPGKNHSSNKTTKDKKNEKEEELQEQPKPTGGAMVRIILKTVLWSLLAALAVVLVIFLALWLRRKIKLRRKEMKFQSENISDGIAWIYADTALLLEKLGFPRGNGSMRDLSKPLEETYGAEFSAEFESATDLNDRAMFSSFPMEEDHRKAAKEFHSHVLQKLKAELKWYKRMWLKWARCLY